MKIFDIFFVDRYNFATLLEHASSGDMVAHEIKSSIEFFARHRPDRVCGICQRPHLIGRSTTFIVVLTKDTMLSLTTCICKKCVGRSDLDARVNDAIGKWPHVIDDCVHVCHSPTVH